MWTIVAPLGSFMFLSALVTVMYYAFNAFKDYGRKSEQNQRVGIAQRIISNTNKDVADAAFIAYVSLICDNYSYQLPKHNITDVSFGNDGSVGSGNTARISFANTRQIELDMNHVYRMHPNNERQKVYELVKDDCLGMVEKSVESVLKAVED